MSWLEAILCHSLAVYKLQPQGKGEHNCMYEQMYGAMT